MILQEIVKIASQVVELGNVVVPRSGYVDSLSKGGVIDQIAEDDVRQVCSTEYERFKIVSVNCIAEGVKKLTGLRAINFQSVTAESRLGTVYSFVIQREGEGPLIVWNNNIDFCWRRFAVTKELSHLLMLSLKIPQENAGREWVAEGDNWLKGLAENTVLDTEASAFLIALELLLPWSLRGQLSQLLSSGISHYHIAKVFFLPTYIINTFLSDVGGESYYSLSNRVNEKIHGVTTI